MHFQQDLLQTCVGRRTWYCYQSQRGNLSIPLEEERATFYSWVLGDDYYLHIFEWLSRTTYFSEWLCHKSPWLLWVPAKSRHLQKKWMENLNIFIFDHYDYSSFVVKCSSLLNSHCFLSASNVLCPIFVEVFSDYQSSPIPIPNSMTLFRLFLWTLWHVAKYPVFTCNVLIDLIHSSMHVTMYNNKKERSKRKKKKKAAKHSMKTIMDEEGFANWERLYWRSHLAAFVICHVVGR